MKQSNLARAPTAVYGTVNGIARAWLSCQTEFPAITSSTLRLAATAFFWAMERFPMAANPLLRVITLRIYGVECLLPSICSTSTILATTAHVGRSLFRACACILNCEQCEHRNIGYPSRSAFLP